MEPLVLNSHSLGTGGILHPLQVALHIPAPDTAQDTVNLSYKTPLKA